ncbi:hypothetical protein TUSST3_76480 [Streptomyces sp. TUS-ST3]|uniref:hypothetical protein n=1 Tax=Streptomyces sp. TUS-ST3 TaxID=3025591 RepID=UPI00235B4661|nr:hypothetical protein [Streptomyces sp. TUS-ST3]GLP71028.1 hypothetical protein TUSST3_76480 [Streptomyces sp. TUS-ST3]
MPLPAGVETVTVSSGEPLTLPDGRLQKGRLIFTAPDVVTVAEDDAVLGGDVEVPLTGGEFSIVLAATDATGMSPSGWTYRVRAALTNAPGWTRYISLPKANPSVKLADVLVPDPVAGAYTVLKDPAYIGDVLVTGTPSAGKVPTATSSSAASWQTPSGGGGGSPIVSTDGRIDQQIITLTSAAAWTIVTTSGGIEIGTAVPADPGDRLWFSPSFLRTGGVVFLDLGIKAAAGGVSRYVSSGTATPSAEGYGPLYPLSSFVGVAGIREFVVQGSEVDGSGNAKIVLAYKGPADGVNQRLYFGGGYSGAIWVANMGPAPT